MARKLFLLAADAAQNWWNYYWQNCDRFQSYLQEFSNSHYKKGSGA
jgi:hypothetical protein